MRMTGELVDKKPASLGFGITDQVAIFCLLMLCMLTVYRPLPGIRQSTTREHCLENNNARERILEPKTCYCGIQLIKYIKKRE